MSEKSHRLLLASASPRRRRLLEMLGVPYDVTSANVEEDLSAGLKPELLARRIASEKAVAAGETAEEGGVERRDTIVTCDTIVVLDEEVLGKPADLDDARRMLRALSGREHHVVTGVALLPPGERAPFTFAVVTRVRMRELTDEDIETWAAKGELLGCAGAYNIESHLATVESTECFQNVAGLPLCHLWRALSTKAFGEQVALTQPCAACEAARGVACELGRELSEAIGEEELKQLAGEDVPQEG